MYALVNEGNIKTLTNELLDYLKVADSEFKPDLTAKVCLLVQRFAPDKRWHFDSLLQVSPPPCIVFCKSSNLRFGIEKCANSCMLRRHKRSPSLL